MKSKDTRRKSSLCGFILPLIAIAAVVLIISFALPYESRGGGGSRGTMEFKEEGGLQIGEIPFQIEPVHLYAEISSLAVTAYDGVYVGEAVLNNLNYDTTNLANTPADNKLARTFVVIIPSNRVQRMFELAMAREIYIKAWAYKIPTPEGHVRSGLDFYRITSAEVLDPNIALYATIVEP